MKILYTERFYSMYKSLPEKIKKKAEKQENIFRLNMFHPSLNTEKLAPKNNDIWSFRVDRSYRVIFHFKSDTIIFLYVGNHDNIYKFL